MIDKRDTHSISSIFRRKLLIMAIVSFAVIVAVFWGLNTAIVNANVRSVLELNLSDTMQDIVDESDAEILESAKTCAEAIDYDQEVDASQDKSFSTIIEEYGLLEESNGDFHLAFLKYLCLAYNVDEINIVDKNGIITMSTNPDNIDFDMKESEVTSPYMCLTEENGPDEYALPLGPTIKDTSVNMKYAGHRLEGGGFVEVGLNEDNYYELVDKQVNDITENRHVGRGGQVIVIRKDGEIVSSAGNTFDGMDVTECGFTMEYLDALTPGEVYKINIMGTDYNVMTQNTEGYYLFAIIPVSEGELARNILFAMMMALEVIVFTLLFVIIYRLIGKTVVGNIKKIAYSLNEISGGNLDVTVNVRGSKEFVALSNDINQTVASLKEYAEIEKKRLASDLKYAEEIQHSSLPTVFPPFPDHKEFDIYASMDPAKEVGGDYYDFDIINSRYLMFCVADVSGKGIPAALFMMKAKTMVMAYVNAVINLDELFERVNNNLCRNNDAEMFVTCWLGVLDVQTGTIHYVNAGHNPPLYRRADGTFEFIKDGNPDFVLGGIENSKYQDKEFYLQCGDELFLYTDGVTEATNKNKELYGNDRLQEFLNNNANLNVENKCKELRKNIDEFVNGEAQFDDITMLSLKYRGFDNTYTTEATRDNYNEIMEFVDKKLEEIECPVPIAMKINVATDEILANIISYAYGSAIGRVTVSVDKCEERDGVVLRFVDRGVPFNPLDREDPDITLSAEERKIGGLGIFMVKKMMDKVEYEYSNSNNLILTKYF